MKYKVGDVFVFLDKFKMRIVGIHNNKYITQIIYTQGRPYITFMDDNRIDLHCELVKGT